MANNNLVPHLPAEIIEFQILSRLPVKSAVRFQSVCKPWKLLISSNPYFVKTQLDNSNYNSILLRRGRDVGSILRGCDDYDLHANTKIIGCINGLVCLLNWRTTLNDMLTAIWNPATNQCSEIPPLIAKTPDIPYCVGFGFDSVNNDYKVIYITTISERQLVGNIYSYNQDRWRKIAPSNFLYHGALLNSNQPVSVNGSIYWLNLQLQADGVNARLTVISFDVGHKVFRLLPDSFDHKESENDVVLVNMMDSVAVIFYDWTLFLGNTIDIHIFDERFGVWSKMCVGPFIGQEPTFLLAQKLLNCFPNGDILFAGPDLKLYCVSPEKHTIKSLKSPVKKGNKYNYYYEGCTYSGSLIFIDGMEKLLYDNHDQVEVFSLEND